jgi:hypothetical protein
VKKFKILIIGKNSFIGSNVHYFLKTKYSSKIQSFKENIKKKLKIYNLDNENDNESFFLNNSKLLKRIHLKITKQKLKSECLKLSKKLFE